MYRRGDDLTHPTTAPLVHLTCSVPSRETQSAQMPLPRTHPARRLPLALHLLAFPPTSLPNVFCSYINFSVS